MEPTNRRRENRNKICLHAFVSDLGDAFNVKCVIRDVTRSGCMIVSNQLSGIPEFLNLVPEGFDQPIRARVMWRDGNRAGLLFEHASDKEIRDKFEEIWNSLHDDGDEDVLDLSFKPQPISYAARLSRYQRPIR